MSSRSRTTLAVLGGMLLGIGVSMVTAVWADRVATAESTARRIDASGLPSHDLHRLAEILGRVKREYVDRVDDHELMENAVRGMVSALDPYSAYLDAEEYDEVRESTSGTYPGVGVEVSAEPAGIRVLRPLADSPASRAGIRADDVIVRVDDVPVSRDLDAAIAKMRGPEGSVVRLTLHRASLSKDLEVELRRARVDVHSVASSMLEPGFGYVRIASFSDTTAEDVDHAVRELISRNNKPLSGLVIDLRDNPGGVLESAVDVADEFLSNGLIVSADGRATDAKFRLVATPGDVLDGAPMTVLVNGGSASAAEILAGALKDQHRATLIGRRTYGKGLVQTVIPLSEGHALKLTTSRYFTPSGATIQEHGIEPDIAITGEETPPAEPDNGTPSAVVLRDREVTLALDAVKLQVGQKQLAAHRSGL